MAINKGRYVVTGGFMEPDGTIVEETQYVPNTPHNPDYITSQINNLINGNKTPTQVRIEDGLYSSGVNGTWSPSYAEPITNTSYSFSPAETYRFTSDGYYNQGNTVLGDAWKGIADGLSKYNAEANSTLSGYNALLNFIKDNEAPIQRTAGNLYNKLVSGIADQEAYVNRMFGPEGELTKEVNQYYDDLGNYLATDAGRQAAAIAAQGVHSGASLGSIRAQQNEAYNESFGRYVQAKEQQINAKQQIASNLINFMSTLRKEYGDTTNDYIIEMYKRAADLYEKTAMSALADINAYNSLIASGKSGGGSGGSTSAEDMLKNLIKIMGGEDESSNDDSNTESGGIIESESSSGSSNKKTAQQSTKISSKEKYRQMNKNLQASDANVLTKTAGNVGEFFSYLTPEWLWNIASGGLNTYK